MRSQLNQVVSGLISGLLVVASLSVTSFGQKQATFGKTSLPAPEAGIVDLLAPTPIQLSGNPNCATLNASTNPAFAHISGDWERKFDPPSGGGPFPFTSGLSGGIPTNANLFMTYSMGPATQMNSFQMSWTTPSALNMLVSAVIVKGGPNGANVYTYPTLTAGDNAGPFTVPGGAQAVSHISFCFEPFSAPSASSAGISGRVLTSGGNPISGATVMIQNLNTGSTNYLLTNSYGRYATKSLPVGDFYAVTVMHRRYIFDDATRYFTLEDNLTDMDFTSR